MSFGNGRPSGFSEADRTKGSIANEARRAAIRRLMILRADDFEQLLNEERAARGLGPKENIKLPKRDMERLARLAIEAGLR